MNATDPATDRRPIASREHAVWKRLAAWLIARGVAPNTISIAGMLAGIGAGGALAGTPLAPDAERALWGAAAVLIQLRLLANMLDGMVAVGAGISSRVGELYNEVPDRVSDAAVLVGAGYAVGGEPWLGFAAAILAVFTAYVRAVGKAAGAGSDFRGPMAKQQRMFLVTAVALYMALAPGLWRLHWGPADSWGLAAAVLALIAVGCVVTSLRRLRGIGARLREPAP